MSESPVPQQPRIQNSWSIYKTKGAVQFDFSEVSGKQGTVRRKVVFIASAPGSDRKYDWQNNKINIMLGVHDILAIVHGIRNGLKEPVKILHDPGAKSDKAGAIIRGLQFVKGEQTGYFINMYEKAGDVTKKTGVNITDAELYGILVYLEAALPLVQGISY